LYVLAEDIFKLRNSHGQDLTFSDLEIQKQNAIEESRLSVRRSNMMVLKSAEGL
jgi:hypothetical protein